MKLSPNQIAQFASIGIHLAEPVDLRSLPDPFAMMQGLPPDECQHEFAEQLVSEGLAMLVALDGREATMKLLRNIADRIEAGGTHGN